MKWFSEMMMNFFIRMIVGILLIFLVNQYLVSQSVDVNVEINPVTAITTGALGVPGVCLLYGIGFYNGF